MIDFSAYLNFVCTDRRETRLLYTVTDALLSLEAQTVERQKPGNGKLEESHQQVERFPVLTGLRKYALDEKREHVLLAGRPGSGKSTTLKQMLLEMTEAALTDDTQPIPVLVQLKGDRSIFDLISAEFRRAKLKVTAEQIDDWLLEDKLVLLLDGINEIPSEDLRTKLQEFRDNNRTTPMIFTTRDLAVGGDLGIEKRLEMCPLSELQMREFVQKYLPEQGEMLLGQISDRLREVADTPLLLKMLCDVYSDPRLFEKVGDLKSKGELFRLFDQTYNNWKVCEGVRTSEKFWKWNTELLQHLAFVMLQGDGLTKPRFTIDKNEAARLIEKYLTGRVENPGDKAKDWLEDLVEHHLLQVAADARKIEFHHQLFQEYYAAEGWLVMLRDKHSDVMDDQRLKHFYLNCLKWTEAIAMMLALLEDETQALRVVRLALEVDLYMGSRLAGTVRPDYQAKTIALIEKLPHSIKISEELIVQLLGETGSEQVISALLERLNDSSFDIQVIAAQALGKFASKQAALGLLQFIEKPRFGYSDDVFAAFDALGKIGNEQAISGLIRLLNNSDPTLQWSAANALGKTGSRKAIPALLKLAEDTESSSRGSAVEALGKLGSDQVIQTSNNLLKDPKFYIRESAVQALCEIGSDQAIQVLINWSKDSNPSVRTNVAQALGKIASKQAVQVLINLLKDSNSHVRASAAHELGRILSEQSIPELTEALNYSDEYEPCDAADAYENWRQNNYAQVSVSIALGEIGTEQAIAPLLQALKDSDSDIDTRICAAMGLGKLGGEQAIPLLLRALDDPDEYMVACAASTLGEIGSEETIEPLRQALKRSDYGSVLSDTIVFALGEIVGAKLLAELWQWHLEFPMYKQAIAAIQANCQFYNYEIAQWKPKPLPPSPTDILVKIDKTTQDTNRRTKQMADQPKNDFSGAIFQAPVNFGDKNQGNFIGTQNNYAALQATAAAQQLKTLLGKLRQKDPNATDEQLFDMLLNGFKTMPQQNPQNWQHWQDIFSILFAGGVEATKILVPVAGIPIEVLKRLYEIYQRNPKQLPGN